MKKKDIKKITLKPQRELSTRVLSVAGKRYLVLTEDLGAEKHLISTRVYLEGEIVSTKKTDYKDILNTADPDKELRELMRRQHELAVNLLKPVEAKGKKTPSEYLDEIKTLLQRKSHAKALRLLNAALEQYPNEPFILSYYGCLEAILNKNYTYGIGACLKAIKILQERMPFGHEFFYPVLYLNLGRTYLAAGNKKNAIETFQKGLVFDNENKDLLQEIKKLGIRRKPVVRFLPRSHPINKYIGIILHRLRS
jgi:tetratricopeptide (TPR) repeat protein